MKSNVSRYADFCFIQAIGLIKLFLADFKAIIISSGEYGACWYVRMSVALNHLLGLPLLPKSIIRVISVPMISKTYLIYRCRYIFILK
jgi:hypothetical protein